MPRHEKELLARDAKRNIGKELLQAVRDIKAGKEGTRYKAHVNTTTGRGTKPIKK